MVNFLAFHRFTDLDAIGDAGSRPGTWQQVCWRTPGSRSPTGRARRRSHHRCVADRYGDYAKVGFDCSGLALYAYVGIGVSVPHQTQAIWAAFPHLTDRAALQPGDLLLYSDNGAANGVHHVRIYLGEDRGRDQTQAAGSWTLGDSPLGKEGELLPLVQDESLSALVHAEEASHDDNEYVRHTEESR